MVFTVYTISIITSSFLEFGGDFFVNVITVPICMILQCAC